MLCWFGTQIHFPLEDILYFIISCLSHYRARQIDLSRISYVTPYVSHTDAVKVVHAKWIDCWKMLHLYSPSMNNDLVQIAR